MNEPSTTKRPPTWRSVFLRSFLVIGIGAGTCLAIGIALNRYFLPSPSHPTVRDHLRAIALAIDAYERDHDGKPPEKLEALLVVRPDVGAPYINHIPSDPWGRPYHYEFDDHGNYRAYTYGRDGKPGGEDEDFDLDHRWATRDE